MSLIIKSTVFITTEKFCLLDDIKCVLVYRPRIVNENVQLQLIDYLTFVFCPNFYLSILCGFSINKEVS